MMLTTLLFANNAIGEEAKKSHLYFEFGKASFDAINAEQEGIKDSGQYFRLGYEAQHKLLVFGGGMSGFGYSDNNSFKQRVEDQFGNRSTESSSADSFNLYGEAGLSYSPVRFVSLDLMLGKEMILQSSRGIGSCSGCDNEDIDMNVGLHSKSRIKFIFPNGFIASLSYQQFFDGDADSIVGLSIGIGR